MWPPKFQNIQFHLSDRSETAFCVKTSGFVGVCGLHLLQHEPNMTSGDEVLNLSRGENTPETTVSPPPPPPPLLVDHVGTDFQSVEDEQYMPVHT